MAIAAASVCSGFWRHWFVKLGSSYQSLMLFVQCGFKKSTPKRHNFRNAQSSIPGHHPLSSQGRKKGGSSLRRLVTTENYQLSIIKMKCYPTISVVDAYLLSFIYPKNAVFPLTYTWCFTPLRWYTCCFFLYPFTIHHASTASTHHCRDPQLWKMRLNMWSYSLSKEAGSICQAFWKDKAHACLFQHMDMKISKNQCMLNHAPGFCLVFYMCFPPIFLNCQD